MTNEQKRLLEIDLCSRLPHGVKYWYADPYDHELDEIGIIESYNNKSKSFHTDKGTIVRVESNTVKVLLFPISSMTREITISTYNDGKPFVPIRHLLSMYCFDVDKMSGEEIELYANSLVDVDISLMTAEFLNQIHVDYRGLIEQNLAISVETLESNPYAL